MREVYIVLTYTGTILSKVIKLYTKCEFSHVSISLDKNLSEMYSFGRLNAYNPFIGGFVHESINNGTFYRFKKTKTKILSFKINNDQYEKIKQIISYINNNKKLYKFNMLGLFAAGLKIKLEFRKAYYCAEFVKYILDSSDIDMNLPNIIKPEDFKYIDNSKEIYTGLLIDYPKFIN